MRAMTVRQPWAWAEVYGGKDVENRSRNIAGAYRGLVAIHAGLKVDADYDVTLIGQAVGRLARAKPGGPGLRDVAQRAGEPLTPGNAISERFGNLGAVIGVVDLVDVHWSGMECSRGATGCHEYDLCFPWAQAYHHHLVLANPRPLATPVRARGLLGLWTLPADVEAQVLAQIGSTP